MKTDDGQLPLPFDGPLTFTVQTADDADAVRKVIADAALQIARLLEDVYAGGYTAGYKAAITLVMDKLEKRAVGNAPR